ncbi:MAG: HTH arsR-type domain-containing protein [Lactococcus sp.]|jgi:ArsR family transcriptional regulator, lead/cadmium/zinc/bismuth-responsive transcriptional repressor
MREESCEITCFDEEKVQTVQEALASYDTFAISQLFKVLADERRLKILYALTTQERLCVCDVALIIGASIATTSYHLRALRKLTILTYEKEGKMVYYQLNNPIIQRLVLDAMTQKKEEITYG